MWARRNVLAGLAAGAASVATVSKYSRAAGDAIVRGRKSTVELQHGDPDTPYEAITIDHAKISSMSHTGRAALNPRNAAFSDMLIETAQQFVGMSRETNEEQITGFLRMFHLGFRDEKDQVVPFCAAGLSYVAAHAYLKFWNSATTATEQVAELRNACVEIGVYHFYPSPSVVDMMLDAQARGRWISTRGKHKPVPKKGWLAVYNFGRPADHCGIVADVSGSQLETIEFNTSDKSHASTKNGGAIRRRPRVYDKTVLGFIQTDKPGTW